MYIHTYIHTYIIAKLMKIDNLKHLRALGTQYVIRGTKDRKIYTVVLDWLKSTLTEYQKFIRS